MDREGLIKEVEDAFSGVRLGEGIGILEATAIDYCVSDKKRKKARNSDIRDDWTKIPKEMIGNNYSALCYVDQEGMRYCLPAYLRFSLLYYKTAYNSVDWAIYALDNSELNVNKFIIFNEQQRIVIARYLRFMITEIGEYWVDAHVATKAYEKYWREFDDNQI